MIETDERDHWPCEEPGCEVCGNPKSGSIPVRSEEDILRERATKQELEGSNKGEPLIGAALGYNDLTVIMAVFSDYDTAIQKLEEWGCVWKQFPVYSKGKRTEELTPLHLVTTERFAEFFSKKGFSMYSTGADFSEGLPFTFLPIELNEPCSGYNDD